MMKWSIKVLTHLNKLKQKITSHESAIIHHVQKKKKHGQNNLQWNNNLVQMCVEVNSSEPLI